MIMLLTLELVLAIIRLWATTTFAKTLIFTYFWWFLPEMPVKCTEIQDNIALKYTKMHGKTYWNCLYFRYLRPKGATKVNAYVPSTRHFDRYFAYFWEMFTQNFSWFCVKKPHLLDSFAFHTSFCEIFDKISTIFDFCSINGIFAYFDKD